MSWQNSPSGESKAGAPRGGRGARDPGRYRDSGYRPGAGSRPPVSMRPQPAIDTEYGGRRASRSEAIGRDRDGEWPPEEGPRRASIRWWPFLVPVAVLGIAVSLLVPAGRHQWALSLFRQPTRYTVLSFNNASSLPSTAALDEPLPISFTIGNDEGRDTNYSYVLTQTADGVSERLGSSSKFVGNGQAWTVSTVIRPSCIGTPCEIEVSLPGHPETIDFLVALKTGK
jgi:hypothetical protein